MMLHLDISFFDVPADDTASPVLRGQGQVELEVPEVGSGEGPLGRMVERQIRVLADKFRLQL